MRLRTADRERSKSSRRRAPQETTAASVRGLVRHLLIGAVILALAYVVSRAVDSVEEPSVPGVGELRDRAEDAVPTEATGIPIGEPGDEEPDTEESGATPPDTAEDEADAGEAATEEGDDTGEGEGDVIEDAETNTGFVDEERSDEEIAERTESDIQEEPAEPGEMTVDEDVAEELVDEGDEEGEREAAAEDEGRETDETEE